jgi:ABC-type bacteriocin/lantibiotic exporter with double-glycine peptidase domain
MILFIGFGKSYGSDEAPDANLDEIQGLLERVRRDYFSCGPNALALALRLRGHRVGLDKLLESVEVSPEGVTLAELLTVARKFEPESQFVLSRDKTASRLWLPTVVVLHGKHAVVLLDVDEAGDTVTVADSVGYQVRRLTGGEFRSRWTGEALLWPMSYGTGALIVIEFAAVFATVVSSVLLHRIYSQRQATKIPTVRN